MMRTLTGSLVLFLAAVAWASPVGVYIDDDFAGSALDTNVWNVNDPSYISVSDSKLTLVSPGNWSNCANVGSKVTVAPEAGQTVIMTVTGMESDEWSATPYCGLVGSGDNKIQLLRGDAGNGWGVYIDLGNENGTYRTKILDQSQMTGTYVISWSLDYVAIMRNGDEVFNSDWEGASDNIPSVALRADFLSWGGARLAADSAKLEVVPEPATMSLLVLGGLVAVLRSRR